MLRKHLVINRVAWCSRRESSTVSDVGLCPEGLVSDAGWTPEFAGQFQPSRGTGWFRGAMPAKPASLDEPHQKMAESLTARVGP